jgi:hypothetical protein
MLNKNLVKKIPTFDSITFDQLKDIVGDPELKYISKNFSRYYIQHVKCT